MSAIDAERAGSGSATLSVVRSRPVLLPRELSDEEYALFSRVGRRRELKPGEVIFSRGELGRSMFIVESGQIQLEFGDGMPDKLIGAREFFGELALFIGNHARVANAVAVAPSALHRRREPGVRRSHRQRAARCSRTSCAARSRISSRASSS